MDAAQGILRHVSKSLRRREMLQAWNAKWRVSTKRRETFAYSPTTEGRMKLKNGIGIIIPHSTCLRTRQLSLQADRVRPPAGTLVSTLRKRNGRNFIEFPVRMPSL